MADEKVVENLIKEVSKDIVENDVIVVKSNSAKRLIELRKASFDVQNQFNLITSTILDSLGAVGNYNTIFDNDGIGVMLVRVVVAKEDNIVQLPPKEK